MIILQPISTPQSITVYLRKQVEYCTIILTEEETQDEYTFMVEGVYDSGQLTFEISFAFVNNRFYWLKVYEWPLTDYAERVLADAGTLEAVQCLVPLTENQTPLLNLNKSKIFVTDQTDLEKYSMTNGYFQEIEKDERTYTVKQ